MVEIALKSGYICENYDGGRRDVCLRRVLRCSCVAVVSSEGYVEGLVIRVARRWSGRGGKGEEERKRDDVLEGGRM